MVLAMLRVGQEGLEREERERILREGGSNTNQQQKPPGDDDSELPPYQEF